MTNQPVLIPLASSIQLPFQFPASHSSAHPCSHNAQHVTVTVDDRAVKEAVIDQVAKELCNGLRLSSSSFTESEESMKQALASALVVTQQKVIANPLTFVKIAKKVSEAC